jgi:signal transduction histidine kinase
LQNIRNSIADDLHDDIGSTLSSISIMNELAKAKSPQAIPLLTSIGEYTEAIQDNMSDIVWTVNPANDHFKSLSDRMNLFATEILDAKNIQFEFISDPSLNSSKLTMKQRKSLYLFFKETINNSAKHSGATRIVVNIQKKDQGIEINIHDNGNGFDTTAIYNGNGMSSLKRRAEDLSAAYSIDSQANKGTRIQLKFKIT